MIWLTHARGFYFGNSRPLNRALEPFKTSEMQSLPSQV